MKDIDRIKIERMRQVFERNYRVTRMIANLLEIYPEIINSEMIDALTVDGEISQSEAVVALLSEIFGLDFEKSEDRIIIRDYLTPSVRILDKSKYENNPYYKTVKLHNIIDGNWEIRLESYAPYRAVICDDMMLCEDMREIPPLGFFTEKFHFPAILEGGNEWMTLTPVDLDTCEEAISAARGRVVTFGLGLGYYAFMASEKDEVESVTVVELSPDVIRLFEKYILPQMPNGHKIKIVNADAFEFAKNVMPKENFDIAFVDTWRDASDGAPMYERMKRLESLSPHTKFLYWIENFLISRIRSLKFAEIMDRLDSQEDFADFESVRREIFDFES